MRLYTGGELTCCVVGVHGDLVLGSVTDKTRIFEEGDIRRCGAVTLVIGDDLNSIILPDLDAAGEDGQIRYVKLKLRVATINPGARIWPAKSEEIV